MAFCGSAEELPETFPLTSILITLAMASGAEAGTVIFSPLLDDEVFKGLPEANNFAESTGFFRPGIFNFPSVGQLKTVMYKVVPVLVSFLVQRPQSKGWMGLAWVA